VPAAPPRPAESYYRSWSAESDPLIMPPAYDLPPMVLEPRVDPRRRPRHHHRP
jgi:hypothetical protein